MARGSAINLQLVTGSAVDLAGNVTPGSVAVNVDKTPPEAYNQFDPVGHDVVLFGRDSLSGVAPGPIQPISVSVLKAGQDNDGDDMGCPDADDVRIELRTYNILDLAGNPTVVVEKVKKRGNSIRAKFISLQYEQGPVMPIARNRESFDWTQGSDGTLQQLVQEFRIAPNWDGSAVKATFDAQANQTLVIQQLPKPRTKTVEQGLDLLRMATATGKLSIEF